jgi:phage repressor protein C with HTH and peptisase S24 domain/DNA-binding XRE family transcriptional regulator
MELNERLKYARETLTIGQKEMAEVLGIGLKSWQVYEQGSSVPGGKVFEALIGLGFNANWLLAGIGEMREGMISEENAGSLLIGRKESIDDSFVKIPRYKVDASAGHGAVIHSEQIVDHLAFRSDWVRHALGVPVASLALINVTGDSMEPTLSNGDLILIDTSIRGVDDSGVYVLQFDGKLKVKRIHSKADGSVDLISDNQRYPVETLQGEIAQELGVVGRVVWCGRRM